MNLKVIFLLAMNPVNKQRNLKERRKINGYTEKWKRGTVTVRNDKILPRDFGKTAF